MVSRNIRVGIFVLGGLIFAGLVIFLIGDERRLFSTSTEFRAKFKDVQGLKADAPIRMGGVDVGHVARVGYGDDPKDSTIYVTLSMVSSEATRLDTDSIAHVSSKGLLGDKMIEITRRQRTAADDLHGPPKPVKRGDLLESVEPDDLFSKIQGMSGKADSVMEGVNKVTASLANEQLQSDLRASVASLNVVLRQVSEGDGYPHKFITDKAEAERISHMLENLDRTAAELTSTLVEVRRVAARVESGPGFAHDVIYGDGPKKEIAQFGGAAQELTMALKGVRESDSLVHDMMYGGKGNGAEALNNVTAITADLRVVMAGIRQGKGTVGALLVDPSVYEDMKVLLGNVERNDVLRALVRYSIKQDEKKPDVKVGAQR